MLGSLNKTPAENRIHNKREKKKQETEKVDVSLNYSTLRI